MEMTYVESSNLIAVGYDNGKSVLVIEFKDGSAYEYYSVPEYIFNELLSTDSKGRYAHQNIYKNYAQNKIR